MRQIATGLIYCQSRAAICAGTDQVEHRLCLTEIDASIQKSPLGELARLCLPGSFTKDKLKHLLRDERSAVAVNLDNVLSCVASRLAHDREQNFIDSASRFRIAHGAVIKAVRLQLVILLSVAKKDSSRDSLRISAAHADNSDASFARGSGDRSDRVLLIHKSGIILTTRGPKATHP